jgi:flagellar basal-body rod modification protein FlgD
MTAVNTITTPTTPTTPTSNTSNTSSTTNSTSNTINSGLAALANNQQTFLSLLTTQLKNQNPLSPVDTNQFTQQITQMTGVEQQLLSNQLLQQLVSNQGLPQAVGMIGKTITAPGAKTGDPAITGVVTGVQQVNGQTELNLGSTTQVLMSTVTSVTS